MGKNKALYDTNGFFLGYLKPNAFGVSDMFFLVDDEGKGITYDVYPKYVNEKADQEQPQYPTREPTRLDHIRSKDDFSHKSLEKHYVDREMSDSEEFGGALIGGEQLKFKKSYLENKQFYDTKKKLLDLLNFYKERLKYQSDKSVFNMYKNDPLLNGPIFTKKTKFTKQQFNELLNIKKQIYDTVTNALLKIPDYKPMELLGLPESLKSIGPKPKSKAVKQVAPKKTKKKVKIPKENLLPYCGIGPLRSGYRLGTMSECAELKQVRRFGQYKADSRIISEKKTKKNNRQSKLIELAKLRGRANKIRKDIEYEKDKIKKKDLEIMLSDIQNKIKNINID